MSTPIEEKMDIVAFSLFPPQGPLGEEQKGVAACQEVVVLVVHLVLVLPCTSPDVEDSAFREGVQPCRNRAGADVYDGLVWRHPCPWPRSEEQVVEEIGIKAKDVRFPRRHSRGQGESSESFVRNVRGVHRWAALYNALLSASKKRASPESLTV